MLTEDTIMLVEVFKKYLEQKGRAHRGTAIESSTLSYYNGIMTALEGIATAEDLDEYINCMIALVKAGSDAIFDGEIKRGN